MYVGFPLTCCTSRPMTSSVIDRIHTMATKKIPDGIHFVYNNNTPIALTTTYEDNHGNMTTASEGVEEKVDDENSIDNNNIDPDVDPYLDADVNTENNYFNALDVNENEEDIASITSNPKQDTATF